MAFPPSSPCVATTLVDAAVRHRSLPGWPGRQRRTSRPGPRRSAGRGAQPRALRSRGGFDGLAQLRGRSGLPLTVHPAAWTQRRLAAPGGPPFELPTLSPAALAREGFQLIERRQPSVLVDGSILITGEVERTTGSSAACRPPTRPGQPRLHHDAEVIDDQALVVHVRGQGLVVLSGCGHAGIVDIVRHAMRLTPACPSCTGDRQLPPRGSAFEPIIAPTVLALPSWRPPCRARPLHRLAGPAHPRRRPPGRLGAQQRGQFLPAERRLTGPAAAPAEHAPPQVSHQAPPERSLPW